MPIRYTHSIGYVFIVGIMALFFRNFIFKKALSLVPFYLFFMAPFSHLVLDFLVAVYGNPYFYPFSTSLFTSALGILPSSGRIDFYNYYFWRNMLIELAIFVPMFMVLVPHVRAYVLKRRLLLLFLSIFFIVGIFVGVRLDRSL